MLHARVRAGHLRPAPSEPLRALSTALGLILGLGSSFSCSSATQNVTSPSTSKCQLTAVAEPASFAAAGGAGTLAVTTTGDCQWTAAASGSWIQLGAPSAGQGNAKVAFSVATNPDPSQRNGTITIEGQQVAISQAAACIFTVSPLSDSVSPDGERRTINVTASGPQCSWSARSATEWLTIVQGSEGTGSAQVVYEAALTAGPPRSGELTIAGQRVAVTQGGGCTVAIGPTAQTIAAGGGSGAINVTTAAGCSWSAQSEAAWITIASAAQGTGPGVVTFNVGAWNGPSRVGTLRVGQQQFTVTQSSGCRFDISPQSQSVASTGGSGSVEVTTASGCTWTSTSNVPWVSIAGAGSGSGNGTVPLTVAPNTGPARTGTLTIAGQTFTVSQSSACTFGISTQSFAVASAGGSGSVGVTTAAACPWTATSSVPWIAIAGGGSGTGNGTVQFDVAPTTGPARTGTLTIAGHTFTVSQSSGCTFSISPAAQAVGDGGGPGSVAVSTSPGCVWTAASSATWARITSGPSGTGAGNVAFIVDPTPTSLPRSTTLSIAGHTFTINQAGAPCLYVLSPAFASLPVTGGSGSFEVNTPEGCTWTAVSNASWLHVTAGASGSGDGTVSFSADPNPGSVRTGAIVVGGRAFTASQAAP